MSTPKKYKILFLCTGNSARSVFGEYLIRRIAPDRFESYSAGASPSGKVNPYTVKVLSEIHKIDASDARSKSWEEFKSVELDFVITVCDNARESCPVWPGQPIIAHWGAPDPAAFEGTDAEKMKFFKDVSMLIRRRIELFCSLPLEKLTRLRMQELTQDVAEKEQMDSNVTHA